MELQNSAKHEANLIPLFIYRPLVNDKIAGGDFGRRARVGRSEAEDERPSPAASNLTL